MLESLSETGILLGVGSKEQRLDPALPCLSSAPEGVVPVLSNKDAPGSHLRTA